MLLEDLYFDPLRESAYSSFEKLHNAAKQIGIEQPSDVKPWIEQQDAYTLHRPVRKRFLRNPYSVNNILDDFECDLVDVQSISRHNDGYKYILSVIEVHSQNNCIWSL